MEREEGEKTRNLPFEMSKQPKFKSTSKKSNTNTDTNKFNNWNENSLQMKCKFIRQMNKNINVCQNSEKSV